MKTEENGIKRKKSEATPFWRPLLQNPDIMFLLAFSFPLICSPCSTSTATLWMSHLFILLPGSPPPYRSTPLVCNLAKISMIRMTAKEILMMKSSGAERVAITDGWFFQSSVCKSKSRSGVRHDKSRKMKQTFCGPKWAVWDPHFEPRIVPKSFCGSLFCILSQEMRHINFFVLGGQNGGFWCGQKVYHPGRNYYKRVPRNNYFCKNVLWSFSSFF